ncbi:MAG TPA: septum formation inhibitor Maf [Anaerolineae bacterium]|nr:septum formation inhibitor Maf [Anaerolineae bacterium]HID83519.1 septum formation inhibitor Maf [Anaerolineales bacterium]HIQ08800.1 septum formation inhibitor Maf [Anaerolineaceae bacterium]
MHQAAGIVLASGSPRRRDLVTWLGFPVVGRAVDVDERRLPEESPARYVRRLAEQKARAGAIGAPAGWVVVGGDTAVVFQGRVLGKPRDGVEARHMLEALRGRPHQVLSGVAVYRPADEALWSTVVGTRVFMRAMSDAELEAYIASGDPMDKAGAYAIQNQDFHPVERIEGCYANVVGLPLCHLAQGLAALLGPPRHQVALQCQRAFGYNCPIHERVFPV